MKTRDFIYVALIGGLGWLLFSTRKNQKPTISNLTPKTKPDDISNAPENNPEHQDLFKGNEDSENPKVMTIDSEGTFTQHSLLESFVIPHTDFMSIYSKVDGRFYYQEKGILRKSVKIEIPEIEYIRALDIYTTKVEPYKIKK